MEINFKGRKVSTKHFDGTFEMDKIKYIKNNYYKPNYEKAIEQLEGILLLDKVNTNHVYSYWFEKIANDGILYTSLWAINELLESNELMQLFINKTKLNEKVFNSTDLVDNFKTAIRLGGKGYVSKLTNFPLKECVKIIDTYCKGNVYIDTSAGWGIRMLASAVLNKNYVGFDINPLLIEKLREFGKAIKQFKPNWKFRLYEVGSEKFQEPLVEQSDFIFTSPPYFNLENYTNVKKGELEIDKLNYQQWLEQYVKPLMSNCYNYAKKDTFVAFNIKSFKENDLVKDFEKLGIEAGLDFYKYDSLKNNQRINSKSGLNDNSEVIVVFKKNG